MNDPDRLYWSTAMAVYTQYSGRCARTQLASIGFSVGGPPSKTLVLPDIDEEIGDLMWFVNLFRRDTDPLALEVNIR